MKLITCGDSYTEGEGMANPTKECWPYLLAKKLKADVHLNYGASAASELMIAEQVERSIKHNPDLVVIAHTSPYRWQTRKKNGWQGFLVANQSQWILSEQIIESKHKAAWHGAAMLFYSDPELVGRLYRSALALGITVLKQNNIPHVHMCCFENTLYQLQPLTNNYIDLHLDKMKVQDFAPDRSHAGPASHKIVTYSLYKKIEELYPHLIQHKYLQA